MATSVAALLVRARLSLHAHGANSVPVGSSADAPCHLPEAAEGRLRAQALRSDGRCPAMGQRPVGGLG